MKKTAWDYALEFIIVATDIDNANDLLGKTDDINERNILSQKIDILESKLFEIRDKLKNLKLT